MKAFLLAAGLGTRLKPFTDHHPKALVKVGGVTLLERSIRKLQKFEINEFVINVHHFADQIKDFLAENEGFGSRYTISDESDELLETGGAVKKAAPLFGNTENILMMNVDILSNIDLRSLIQYHLVHNPYATLAVQERNSTRKMLFEENDRDELVLKGWKNTENNELKPLGLNVSHITKEYAFSGIQIIHTDMIKSMKRTGKFSIVDAYLDLMSDHKILGYDHTQDIVIDAGKPEAIEQAEKIFTL